MRFVAALASLIMLALLPGCHDADGSTRSNLPECVSIYLNKGHPTFRFYQDVAVYKHHPGVVEVKGFLSFIHKDFSAQMSFGLSHDTIKLDDIEEIRLDELHVRSWSIEEYEKVFERPHPTKK